VDVVSICIYHTIISSQWFLHGMKEGLATLSLLWVTLAIHIFVEGCKEINNDMIIK
jgi:hypothetical protein